MTTSSGNIKITVVGDAAVGKTCLLVSYITDKFQADYVPTDTSGVADYYHLSRLTYNNADIFIVCFAVDDPRSFANVKSKWIPEIRTFTAPYVIVGTKRDVRDQGFSADNRNRKFITNKMGHKLAQELKAQCYLECSAVSSASVKRVFNEVITKVLQSNYGDQQMKKRNKCSLM